MGLTFLNNLANIAGKKHGQMMSVDLGSRMTKAVLLERRGGVFALTRYALLDAPIFEKAFSPEVLAEHLKAVSEALKKENPGLKLYVVRYTWQDQNELLPYLEHFDVINLWVWVSTEHYWRAEYAPELGRIKKLTGKPVIQGLFLHNYGETWNNGDKPVALDLVQLQCEKIFSRIRDSSLEGCIVLQNGWFDRNDHREQLQWMKDYLEWFYGTTTWS